MNRKISAHYIIPANGDIIKNGIITVDKSGKILNITKRDNHINEEHGIEFYNGILVPGFINTHCHLELSHLKDKIKQKIGLPQFISEIRNVRLTDNSSIEKATQLYDNQMYSEGIMAVGDIANTANTLNIKQKSKIKYHTFIELFASNNNIVENRFRDGLSLIKQFKSKQLKASITAHAPYSVVPKLFALIAESLNQANSIMSIHNQECPSENELYESKKGELYEMFKSQGIDLQNIPTSGNSSLKSILKYIKKDTQTILVHNTYSEIEDIEAANNYFDSLFWCLCPNANLYIENRLPNILALRKMSENICIGTDSLASNSQLSILEELKTISSKFETISTEELITWATKNGAKALNLDKELGSIEINKKPGINLIENFDFKTFKLTNESRVKKIV